MKTEFANSKPQVGSACSAFGTKPACILPHTVTSNISRQRHSVHSIETSNHDAPTHPPKNKANKRGQSTVIKKFVWLGLLSVFMALGSVLARRVADNVWRAMVHEDPPTEKG